MEHELQTYNEVEDGTEDEIQSLSYQDIYSSLVMNDELILTIPAEEEEKLKIGIKNVKAKQAAKMKADGLPVDSSSLSFSSTPSKQFQGAVDLHIALLKKAVIPVYKVAIPDKEM